LCVLAVKGVGAFEIAFAFRLTQFRGDVGILIVRPVIVPKERFGRGKSIEIPRVGTRNVVVDRRGAVNGFRIPSPIGVKEFLELKKEFGWTPTNPSPVGIIVVVIIDSPKNDRSGIFIRWQHDHVRFVFLQGIARIIIIERVGIHHGTNTSVDVAFAFG